MTAQPLQLMNPRVCENCGQTVDGKAGKRFCNGRCRATAARRRQRTRMRELLQTLTDTIAELEHLANRE